MTIQEKYINEHVKGYIRNEKTQKIVNYLLDIITDAYVEGYFAAVRYHGLEDDDITIEWEGENE